MISVLLVLVLFVFKREDQKLWLIAKAVIDRRLLWFGRWKVRISLWLSRKLGRVTPVEEIELSAEDHHDTGNDMPGTTDPSLEKSV